MLGGSSVLSSLTASEKKLYWGLVVVAQMLWIFCQMAGEESMRSIRGVIDINGGLTDAVVVVRGINGG